jgi:N-acetylglucosamine kinase-like BadF-type ATPase
MSDATKIVVGVDGGGSKTRVRIADPTGAEIITVDGPASAITPGAADRSATVIAATIADALASAGLSDVRPAAVCVGVAGAGREIERGALWQSLTDRDLSDEIVVHTDATIALDDAFAEGPGILLIAGTGSIAFGRGPTGDVARVGGWGPVIGDEGGGVWLARRALSIVAAAHDGREPDTTLTGAVLTAALVEDVHDLIPWAARATAGELAALAPAVLHAAAAGDPRADTLMAFAAEELALHVRTLARRLFVDERATFSVALSGGLLTRGSPLRKCVERRLSSVVPGAQLHAGEIVPVRGAVRDAVRVALRVAGRR